jgi:hypothetical protein
VIEVNRQLNAMLVIGSHHLGGRGVVEDERSLARSVFSSLEQPELGRKGRALYG